MRLIILALLLSSCAFQGPSFQIGGLSKDKELTTRVENIEAFLKEATKPKVAKKP